MAVGAENCVNFDYGKYPPKNNTLETSPITLDNERSLCTELGGPIRGAQPQHVISFGPKCQRLLAEFLFKKRCRLIGLDWGHWIELEFCWSWTKSSKLEVSWVLSTVFQGKSIRNHGCVQPFFSCFLSLSCRTCFGSLRLDEWWWTLEWVPITTCCWKTHLSHRKNSPIRNHVKDGHWFSETVQTWGKQSDLPK